VSAHWFIAGTNVTNNRFPESIHDFGGFTNELYQVSYSAPGDPDLAGRLQSILAPLPVTLNETWGLDHGAWSVLRQVYRDADIPVIQLSIDARQLAPLRSEGILIMGSGNLVYNLQLYAWGQPLAEPRDWAVRFENSCPNYGAWAMERFHISRAGFREILLEVAKQFPGFRCLVAGYCAQRTDCARESGNPCRFPETMRFSFESVGFDVSSLSMGVLGLLVQWPRQGLPKYYLTVGAVLCAEGEAESVLHALEACFGK
jgi:hypothetical protein